MVSLYCCLIPFDDLDDGKEKDMSEYGWLSLFSCCLLVCDDLAYDEEGRT